MHACRSGSAMRLVFDTQYYRGLHAPELAELRRRGFVLSVSFSAFVEVWGRSLVDDKPGLFFSPARKFSPFIDRSYPIAASSGDLFARLGARPPPGREADAAKYLEWAHVCWIHATTSNADDPFYREHGAAARREIADRKGTWLRLAKSWRVREQRISVEQHERNLNILRAAHPGRLWRAMWRHVREMHPARGMRPPPPQERFNAYLRVAADQLLKTGSETETAAANDAQDLLQLTHVGEVAIFVTQEKKILRLVDQSGTFQAPWIRTLAEVLTERLPRGRPWGRHARRIAASFHRRPYAELRDAEAQLLAEIREEAS
jgi:hypothetical protein